MTDTEDTLDALLADQAGMVARRQLTALGIDADTVRNNVWARRWVARTPRVVSTVTGTLDDEQRRWLAVLHAGPRSMIGGLSAAALHGLSGWDRDRVTVWVDAPLAFEPVDGVDFFRTRRPFDLLRHPRKGLPVARVEPAALLHSAYDAPMRPACALLAATVQQRLTTAERLVEWIDQLRPLRRAKPFKRLLSEVAGGAHSGAELDVAVMCRRAGLVPPARQRSRTDSSGRRRWTDCEWDLPGGGVLLLEIDGSFHMEVRQWAEDKKRGRRLASPGRTVVGCTAYEVRHEDAELAADLRALGVPTLPARAEPGRGSGRGSGRGPGRAPEDAA